MLKAQDNSGNLSAISVQRRKGRPLTDAIDGVRVRMLPDGRMDRANAARYLGRQPKTLAMWALQGKGPRPVKVGGRIFYFREELDAFVRGGQAT
jgi:hypothetical protein